ncbi:MAG: hypothetical protein IPJ00_19100 [Saprospirales bacterium]|nr:hypothetical protein [Saprospirales bacterium]
MAAGVRHVLDLKDWTEEDFTHIKDIGPVVTHEGVASAFSASLELIFHAARHGG